MTKSREEYQHFISTEPVVIDCLMDIIESHDELNWDRLGLDVLVEDKDVYLNDFLEGEEHNGEDDTGVINPIGRVSEEKHPKENLLIYFYVCIMAIKNRADYERMRKEEDDKKAGCDNDNKMGSTRRSRGENSDNAERPLSDAQPST